MAENFYETDKAVSEYLLFHYGLSSEFFEQKIGIDEALDFASRCGRLYMTVQKPGKKQRALDLGCAVGGAAFEMSKEFDEVVGIDFAYSLIESAKTVAQKGKITIPVVVEGDVTREATITAPRLSSPERITFEQGDAMNLSSELGTFDFVLLANLIDRLPDPSQCLQSIHNFVNENGVLAITSPYTWLEEYTPKDKWLGGYYDNNQKAVSSFETLQQILSNKFELIDQFDMPFLIREHSRKNQFTVAHATIWQRK